jgi:hypothetical protein
MKHFVSLLLVVVLLSLVVGNAAHAQEPTPPDLYAADILAALISTQQEAVQAGDTLPLGYYCAWIFLLPAYLSAEAQARQDLNLTSTEEINVDAMTFEEQKAFFTTRTQGEFIFAVCAGVGSIIESEFLQPQQN